MTGPIRVGVIGANPDYGWAMQTHLPIINAMDEFELTAVSTTREETASRSAEKYGARRWYTDNAALVNDPDVDLVTISVRCPDHRELLHLALDSGKHILCEWPLAASTKDAEDVYSHARRAQGHQVIGTQAVAAPAVRQARELVASGFVGTVESVVLRYVVSQGTRERFARHRYLFDPASGAGVLGIHTGHALSAVVHIAGDVTQAAATMHTRNPVLTVVETGEEFRTSEPDHIGITGLINDQIMLVGEVHYTHQHEPFSTIEILGSEGTLRVITTPWPSPGKAKKASLQGGDLRLEMSRDGSQTWQPVDIPAVYPVPPAGLNDYAGYVSNLYSMLAHDLREGTSTAPDFAGAVRIHRMLDAIAESGGHPVRVSPSSEQ